MSAIPAVDDPVVQINARVGDAVIIDICTTHRGSQEEAFQSQAAEDPSRILISTVFGRSNCDFTDRMERGNAERLHSWIHDDQPRPLLPVETPTNLEPRTG